MMNDFISKDECLSAGFDDVVPRPINESILATVIDSHVSLIDFDQVLQVAGGDIEFAKELFILWAEDQRSFISELRDYLKKRDRRSAISLAHMIQGGSNLFLGASVLTRNAANLEFVLKEKRDWSMAIQLFKSLENHMVRTLSYLPNYFAEISLEDEYK
ncbi:MAG: hypothetical protein ACFB2W_06650 [Leptolyngbyaceae cyanobacterium]